MSPNSNSSGQSSPSYGRLTLALSIATVFLCLLLSATAPNPFYLAPFRESQTAITADYLLREPAGGMLAAQLPVLGVPWQLPLEFPLFQRVTAWVAACGISITQAGRLLSFAGFLGCLLVLAKLWRELSLPAQWRKIALAFFAASPVFIYYATSHMIESWALLPALLLVWGSFRFIHGGAWSWLCVVAVAGSLASMIKITTWLPSAGLVSIYLLYLFYEHWKSRDLSSIVRRWLALVISIGIGFLSGVIWTLWAAQVRSPHGAGAGGSSDWVFGGIHDRLSVSNWAMVMVKELCLLFGPLGLLVPLIFILAWWKGGGFANRLNRWALFGLAGFMIHVLVFIKLLLRHDYYVFGSGVFLLLATACACIVLNESMRSKWMRFIPPALVLSMLIGGLVYGILKRGYRDYVVDASIPAVEKVKEPGALITFGMGWSPRLPFEARRKALMISSESEDRLRTLLDKNRQVSFAAIVVVGNRFDRVARLAAQQAGLDAAHPIAFWPNGYLLVKPEAVEVLSAAIQNTNQPVLAELEQRIPPKGSLPDGLVYKRIALPSKNREWFEVIAKRGDVAFFVRGGSLSLVRVDGYFTQH